MHPGRVVVFWFLLLLSRGTVFAATDPMASVNPVPLPGPYAVGCSNVAQDFSLAPTDDARHDYWEGTGAGGPGKYVTQILLEPQGAFTYDVQVPNVKGLFVNFGGTVVPHVALVCYPTSAGNSRPDYPVDVALTTLVPKMQRGTDPPIWADPNARYPVLLYSHGLTGSPLSSEYTLTIAFFASYGYVVVAPFLGVGRFADLQISDLSDLTRLLFEGGYREAIELQAMRPEGLKFALDRVLADPNYRDHVDPERIGGFGASLGGEALLLQAGAQLTTDFLPSLKSAQVMPQDMRVKAMAGYVPYFGQRLLPAFGNDQSGLDGISVPFLAISGTADTTAPIGMTEQGVNRLSGARYVIAFEGLTHTLDLPSVPDMYTWTLTFLSAYLNNDPVARTQMARMGQVNGGASDSVHVDYTPPLPPTGDERIVTEFFNTALGHYFMTADAQEAAAIDLGAAGPGWVHTGYLSKALSRDSATGDQVCRFYGNRNINPATGQPYGPNSHFYTIDPAECAFVRLDPGWKFEAIAFRAISAVAGICPALTIPVWRAYNNGFVRNDSNHRYTTSRSQYAAMLGLGWKGEGVVMCARP
jgi:hypothetical protein